MKYSPVQIVFTDLDGTLLSTAQTVSVKNLACLQQLGRQGIIRVIATGRSYYSFRKAIRQPFPADYLIFSSGAGIIDLASNHLIHSVNLKTEDIATITERLQQQQADFMVHQPAPENHHFVYCRNNDSNDDFQHRLHIYHKFAKEKSDTTTFPDTAAQVIAVLPNDIERFASIASLLEGFQVTRTTSPLDHRSIWMEIQPQNIHKGSAAAWLCDYLGLDQSGSVSIGNDYNDLDLLNFTEQSYLLQNAPAELHHLYRLGLSHDEDGFSHAVQEAIGTP